MDHPSNSATARRVAIVGRGRLGTALAFALSAARVEVLGPFGRGELPHPLDADLAVLLAVPDDAIARAAASIPRGPFVGHCSGALTLDVLGDHDAFSIHPLLSVTERNTRFEGAACAIAGRSPRALDTARLIATELRMEPIEVKDSARSLYHAAASAASNYLVTLEDAAEQLASSTGIERRHLARLAQSALDNWTRLGGPMALTGPIVRGDEATVRRQRDAAEDAVPHLLPLWDALANATRTLANRKSAGLV
ncbi:MAG TPA: DUF2520 domain-containing protein [Gemmatimonadaceae bacterium]|jgi:predicted short-subunit dehydrogenase-like oxidoreductase (DUF2520 family)